MIAKCLIRFSVWRVKIGEIQNIESVRQIIGLTGLYYLHGQYIHHFSCFKILMTHKFPAHF
jgi:hypothetical protein